MNWAPSPSGCSIRRPTAAWSSSPPPPETDGAQWDKAPPCPSERSSDCFGGAGLRLPVRSKFGLLWWGVFQPANPSEARTAFRRVLRSLQTPPRGTSEPPSSFFSASGIMPAPHSADQCPGRDFPMNYQRVPLLGSLLTLLLTAAPLIHGQ